MSTYNFNINPDNEGNYDSDDSYDAPPQTDILVKFPIEDEDFDFHRFSITNRAFKMPAATTQFNTDETISDPITFHDWVAQYNPLLYTDKDLMDYHLAFFQPTGVLIHFNSKEVKNQNSVVQIDSRLLRRLRTLVHAKTGLDHLSRTSHSRLRAHSKK